MASATASPTAAIAAAVAAAVSAAIIATITAAAIILTGTIGTAAGRIVLRGIVMRRKVLRRGRIGFRLAFVSSVSMVVFRRGGRNCVAVIL
jgi:putative effector of murein hydrolase